MSEEGNIQRPLTTGDGQPTEKIISSEQISAPKTEEQPEASNPEPSTPKLVEKNKTIRLAAAKKTIEQLEKDKTQNN